MDPVISTSGLVGCAEELIPSDISFIDIDCLALDTSDSTDLAGLTAVDDVKLADKESETFGKDVLGFLGPSPPAAAFIVLDLVVFQGIRCSRGQHYIGTI